MKTGSYPSRIFAAKSGELVGALAEEPGRLVEAGAAILAAVLDAPGTLSLTVPALVGAGTLALVAGAPRRVLTTRSPVEAGILLASRHSLGASWAGESGLAEAERAVIGRAVIAGRSGQTKATVLAG